MKQSIKFKDYAAQWYVASIAQSSISEGTKRNYRIIIYNHIIPYFSDKNLTEISALDCQILINKYKDNSWSQGNKVRMTLKKIFDKAVSKNLINSNPAKETLLPKSKSSEKSVRKLTIEETKLLYNTYESTGEGLMYILMYETGLRPIEVMNQQWRNIDLENGILKISYPKNRNRKNTEIILSPYLLNELRLIKRYKRYVFNKLSDDKQHNDQSMKYAWKKYLKTAQEISDEQIPYDFSPILICRQKEICS